MGKGGKSTAFSGTSTFFVSPAEADAYLKGQIESDKYKEFSKKIDALQEDVRAKSKAVGKDNVQLFAVHVRPESVETDDEATGTENTKNDVSAYIGAMNYMTMHAATMAQAPSVSPELAVHLPNFPGNLQRAKNNANTWQNKLRPELSKIVTDFIDASNEWTEWTDYMLEETEDAKKQSRGKTKDEKDEILFELKMGLAEMFAELQDGIETKKSRIAGAKMELANLLTLLNGDVEAFTADEKLAENLILGKEDAGLISQLDDAIAANRKRIDSDIGMIVGGSLITAGAIAGGVAIVVFTGGIGTGVAVGLGAVAIAGGGMIAAGAMDLNSAYDDLAENISKKNSLQQDAFLLKSNVSSIGEYSLSATHAANALQTIQGTWDSFGNLLDNYGSKIQEAKDAEKILTMFMKLRTAVRNLQDVKEFSMQNLVPQVGMITYEDAIARQRVDPDDATATRSLPVTFAVAAPVEPVAVATRSRSSAPRTKYNVLASNFTGEHVSPMVSNMTQLTSVAMSIDQQVRRFVEDVPEFVVNQQTQVKNAEKAIGSIEPAFKKALIGMQEFTNVFAVVAEAVATRDATVEELAPYLMGSLDESILMFSKLKDKTMVLSETQRKTMDKLEIDMITARSKLIDPTGKIKLIAAQLETLRKSIDISNGKVADTMLKHGLTNFIDDLSLAVGYSAVAYTTKSADFTSSEKWDLKKQAVGQLSTMGESASKIPDVSEYSNQTMSMLDRYGQLLTASLVAQDDFSTINDAYLSGTVLFERLTKLTFFVDSFIRRLNMLKDNMNFAFKNVKDSPQVLLQKFYDATKSWEDAKKICSAAHRLTTPTQQQTTFIEITKEEIEDTLGVSDIEESSYGSMSRNTVFAVRARPVQSARSKAKDQALDAADFCTTFTKTAMPGDDDSVYKSLQTFMGGLSRRKTAMESTEDALEEESHELNLRVSQLKGERAHAKAELEGTQQALSGLRNDLSRQKSEYRTKKIIYDALAIPTFGWSRLIEAIDDAISQTQKSIDEKVRRMKAQSQKVQDLEDNLRELTIDLDEASKASSQTLSLFIKMGTTIDMTENAIKDRVARVAKVAWRIAQRGAGDIITFTKDNW